MKGAEDKMATHVFDTKSEALKYGREQAQRRQSELVIYGRDGKRQDKDSYGGDPFPPRDDKYLPEEQR
ncbi:MAG: DUF2188 domain-containing protein [Chloroflexota bacterium]